MKLPTSFAILATSLVLPFLTGTAAHAETGVTANEIIIGQDIDMSGTIALRMRPLIQAADAYLAEVNRRGGIHAR